MKKGIFRPILASVMVLCLVLSAACGSKTDDADTGDTTGTTSTDTTASGDEQITITFSTSVYVEEPHQKAIDSLIAAYNQKNPNVQIEVFGSGYADYWNDLTIEIMANNEGDIIQFYPENIPRYHALRNEGTFVDLASYISNSAYGNQLVGQEVCTFDGETLGFSNYAWGTTGIFYRKSLLEEKGINPDDIKTNEDFKQVCQDLAADGMQAMGVVLSAHPFVVSEWARLVARPVSNGLYFKNGESGPYDADNVNVMAAQNLWAALWWQELITEDNAFKLVPDKKDSRELFWNNNVPFNMDGPWFIGMTAERDAALMDDIGLMPQFDVIYNGQTYQPNPTLYPLVTALSKNCAHPEEAWAFMEWMASPEAQEIISSCGMIPSNKDYSESTDYTSTHPLEMQYINFMENNYSDTLISDPAISQFDEIEQVMIDATQAMFSEQAADIETTMYDAHLKIQEIMSK